jgi:hypothetical protein
MRMYYFTPEPKWSSMEWHQKGSPLQKFRTRPSAGKIMASVFWDSEGVVRVDFLPCDVTVNAQYYINLLCIDVDQMVWKRRPGKLSEVVIGHENAHRHTADLMKVALAAVDWEIMNHPPFRLETVDELKCSVAF